MSNVDHPTHYNTFGPLDDDGTAKYEPIKVIEAWGMGPEFCVGNALKYIARAPHKGKPIEDLRKAKWYLDRAAAFAKTGHGDTIIPTPDVSGMDWRSISDAWGLPYNLRNALLNLWSGLTTAAADFVGEEIDRLNKETP